MDFLAHVAAEKRHEFVFPSAEMHESLVKSTRDLYLEVKRTEPREFSPLKHLIVKGFDLEQIWAQMSLENEPFVAWLKTAVDEVVAMPDIQLEMDSSISMDEEEESEGETAVYSHEEDDENENEQEQEESEEEETEEITKETESQEEEDEENDSDIEPQINDGFFSIKEMRSFVNKAEEFDMMDEGRQDHEFFVENDILNQQMNEEDEEDAANANDIYYDDFFGKPQDRRAPQFEKQKNKEKIEEMEYDSYDDGEDLSGAALKDQDATMAEPSAHEEEPMEEDEEELKDKNNTLFDEEEEDDEKLGSFEKKQREMKKMIESLEQEIVSEKPWVLKGEANASIRPMNSLLEQDLDVDFIKRPTPVVTEEATQSLEEIIRARIKDGLFDDVERKRPAAQRDFDPNKGRIQLDEEKSSKSLAQVYEEEYMKQQQGSEFKSEIQSALEKQHAEIEAMFKIVCQNLDALTNWHFTPKPIKPSLEVVPSANVAAIEMEESLPVAVNNSESAAAPQEIYAGQIGKSKAELSKAEKRRQRAKKKVAFKKQKTEKEAEKKIREASNPRPLSEKKEKDNAIQQLLKEKNVTLIGQKDQKNQKDKGEQKLHSLKL